MVAAVEVTAAMRTSPMETSMRTTMKPSAMGTSVGTSAVSAPSMAPKSDRRQAPRKDETYAHDDNQLFHLVPLLQFIVITGEITPMGLC